MRFGQYQEVNVTVTSATFSRLKQGNPFNKRRVTHLTLKNSNRHGEMDRKDCPQPAKHDT
jgi:hypothetical protein